MSSSADPHHSNHNEDEEAMPAWPIGYETTNERFDVARADGQPDNSNTQFVDDSWGISFSYTQPTDFDINAQYEDQYDDMYIQWPPAPENDDVHGMRADGLSLPPRAPMPLDLMPGADQHVLVRAVSPSLQPWDPMVLDSMLEANQPDVVRAASPSPQPWASMALDPDQPELTLAVSPPSSLPSSRNELSPSPAEAAAGEDSQSKAISQCEVRKDSRFARDGHGQWSNDRCTKQATEHEGFPKSLRWCNSHTQVGYPYFQLMTGRDPRQLWTKLTTEEQVDVVIGLLNKVGRRLSEEASSLLPRARANRPAITRVVEQSDYPDLSRLPWVPRTWGRMIGAQEIEANPNNARLYSSLHDYGTMDSNEPWGPSVRKTVGRKKKVRDRCEAKQDPLFMNNRSRPGHWIDGQCGRGAVDHKRLPKSLRWCQQHTRDGYPFKQLMMGQDPHHKWPQLTTKERVEVFKVLIDISLASTRDPILERVRSDSGDYSGALTRAAEQQPYPDLSIHSWLPACWRSGQFGSAQRKE